MSSEATSTNARSRWGEFLVESGIRLLGFSTIGFVVLIFFFLLRKGFRRLLEYRSAIYSGRAGIRPLTSSACSL